VKQRSIGGLELDSKASKRPASDDPPRQGRSKRQRDFYAVQQSIRTLKERRWVLITTPAEAFMYAPLAERVDDASAAEHFHG